MSAPPLNNFLTPIYSNKHLLPPVSLRNNLNVLKSQPPSPTSPPPPPQENKIMSSLEEMHTSTI